MTLQKFVGPVTHIAAGGALWLLFWLLSTPTVAALVAILAVGVAHEVGDGDFLQVNGGPRNGLLDVAWFTPVPILAILGRLL